MSRSVYDLYQGGMFANKRGEQDVTIRVTDKNGEEQLVNGFMKDLGCPVLGFHLDSDPEEVYEVAYGEIELDLMDYFGSVEKVTAWLHSAKLGQQVILKDCRPVGKLNELRGSKYHFRVGIER